MPFELAAIHAVHDLDGANKHAGRELVGLQSVLLVSLRVTARFTSVNKDALPEFNGDAALADRPGSAVASYVEDGE